MNKLSLFSFTLIALAVAGCSSVPVDNAQLELARSDFRAAEANPQARNLAPLEMKAAGDALSSANQAFARRDSLAEVDHLAYIARQRVAFAQQTGERKASEAAVAEAAGARDKLRLAARTNEADAAQATAVSAQRSAQMAQQQSDASQRVAAASQQQASESERRARALEAQLRELNAKSTDRGMVITMGDVLFDTGRAELKPGGMRSVERLAGFMKEYPQRKAMIEGFTDSTGSESGNQALSDRRAEAVRAAIQHMGVDVGRLSAQGYGGSFPVAGNDSAGGRQMNRRVEIVLSDDAGKLKLR